MTQQETVRPVHAAAGKIGRYEIIRKLGEGATSSVYLCRDPMDGRDVAVKLVAWSTNGEAGGRDVMRRLFLTEASLAGKLVHPNIVAIYGAAADDRSAYLVMEYVRGGTLKRYTCPENLLEVGGVIEIVHRCARALDFASQMGIIHRDIKPANLLITDDNDIKIADFGTAAMLQAGRTPAGGIGTPAYMSPEQHLDQRVTHQTDIYALGVVMFQLLTGRLPFYASNIAALAYQVLNRTPPPPSEFRPEIPAEVDAVVRRAIERDPAARYPTWEEFARDLAALAPKTPRSTRAMRSAPNAPPEPGSSSA